MRITTLVSSSRSELRLLIKGSRQIPRYVQRHSQVAAGLGFQHLRLKNFPKKGLQSAMY
jgi:hypothetical protein